MRSALRLLCCASLLWGGCGGASGATDSDMVTLAFGGDVMLARQVSRAILERGAASVWADVGPLLRNADLALVNLECVIASSGKPFVPRRVFSFNAHPKVIKALTLAGIDYVSLANNHALDYQAPALLECIRRLDEAGIAHAGAGKNLEAASRPAILQAGKLRIGVVSFADHFKLYAAGKDTPGTNVIPISLKEESFGRVRGALSAARRAGADLVVFSIHWGPNMRQVPGPHFRAFARKVLNAGADIFHGHSAHVFQGIEIWDGKPILYDTGDLLDDYAIRQDVRNDEQILFLLHVSRKGVRRIELVPVHIRNKKVRLATGTTVKSIQRRMRRLCGDMGTRVEVSGDRLVIRIPQPPPILR